MKTCELVRSMQNFRFSSKTAQQNFIRSFKVVWSLIVDSFGVSDQAMQINVQFNNILPPLLWIHAIDSILVPTEQTFSSLYEVCIQKIGWSVGRILLKKEGCKVKRSESGSISSKPYFMKGTLQVYQLFWQKTSLAAFDNITEINYLSIYLHVSISLLFLPELYYDHSILSCTKQGNIC